MLHTQVHISNILYEYFLTIHERARVIESDELAQKNRVSTTGMGGTINITIMVTLSIIYKLEEATHSQLKFLR